MTADLDYDALLDALDAGTPIVAPADDAPPPSRDAVADAADPIDTIVGSLDAATLSAEFTVETNGQVRQAGAATADGAFVTALKTKAERSLFTFAKAILGRDYLTTALHRPVCKWLTDFSTKRRKGLLLPREHAKSSLVSHALPLHILLQPRESNLYFPNEPGVEQRVVLACVTADLAKKHLGVQRRILERNQLLRAFWPHVTWEKPSRDAPRWNNVEFDVPRHGDWPDPSVRAIGVDGAITGAHPSVLVKDDLIEIEAANSPLVMATAIEWHKASRALINKPSSLEFIIGTRWAVHDLYSEVQEHDPTVEWHIRQAIEDGRVLYPEGGFSDAKLAELQRDMGTLFLLLYMNSAADPSLTDFDLSLLRSYSIDQGTILIPDDARDLQLREETDPVARAIGGTVTSQTNRGTTLASWLSKREGRRADHFTRPAHATDSVGGMRVRVS